MNSSPDIQPFDWTIDEAATWPPRGRRHPPYGPTTMEAMRSCSVRTFFESSKGYERRMAYSGRVGSAYHATLQSLMDDPPDVTTDAAAADETRRRFYAQIAKQDSQANTRPRERDLPKDEARIARALESLVIEAQQLSRFACHSHVSHVSGPSLSETPTFASASTESITTDTLIQVQIEQHLQSIDGIFQGVLTALSTSLPVSAW